MKALVTCVLFLWLSSASQAGIIFIEDFEDDVLTYSSSNPDALLDIGNNDYYGRLNTATQPSNLSYSNLLGTGYYGVQDTDGATPLPVDVIDLYWNNINISQWDNIVLSWFIAEGNSSDGAEDIDSNTGFNIMAQIDGGGFDKIFAVSGSGTNTKAQVDTDFDGVADGTEITDIFTQYFKSITTGSLLDIKVSFENFDAGDEDFAFDQLTLSGDLKSAVTAPAKDIPEPPILLLLLISLIGALSKSTFERH